MMRRPIGAGQKRFLQAILDPAPSAHTPLHGISQTKLRSSRERKLPLRMMRSTQRSGGSSGGAASSPRFACHSRLRGNASSHQRFSVEAGTPPATRDRLQPHAAGKRQRAHQEEQRTHVEPSAEETHRRRFHPVPANRTAQAEAPHVVAKNPPPDRAACAGRSRCEAPRRSAGSAQHGRPAPRSRRPA